MKRNRPRFARARGGLLAAAALLALVAACDAPLPTSADVDKMDVASAEKWATSMKMFESATDSVVYAIDGVLASADDAHALDPAQISNIMVGHARMILGNEFVDSALGPGSHDFIAITTRKAAERWARSGPTFVPVKKSAADERARVLNIELASRDSASHAPRFVIRDTSGALRSVTPLFVIDGVPADSAAVEKLSPQAIKSVEVIKGASATALYSDPRAANGVIKISTHDKP